MDNPGMRDDFGSGGRTKPVGTYAGAATPSDATAVGEPMDVLPGQGTSGRGASGTSAGGGSEATTTGKMTSKVDAGMGKAADGIDKLVGVVRDKGQQYGQSSGAAGTVGSVATAAAGKLEGASHYLHQTDSDHLMTDLEALIRRKPVESLLVAAGVGFVFAKAIR